MTHPQNTELHGTEDTALVGLPDGAGIVLHGAELGALGAAAQTKPLTLVQTLLHIFPTSVIDAMARGDVLQMVAFSALFALAVIAAGEAGNRCSRGARRSRR